MTPRGEGRHCTRCDHVVVDLSRMTRREAERRIARERGDYLCIRMAVDERGEAVFRKPPVTSLAGGLVLVAALTAGGCRDRAPSEPAEVAMEPCSLEPVVPEPVMLPAGEAPEPEPVAAVDPWPVEVADEDAAVPTAEQRELTRRKQERRRQAAHPPIRHHVAGRMPIRRHPPVF